MALPPILTNLPVLKLFRTNDSKPPAVDKPPAKAGSTHTQDVVDISEAARKKLEGEKELSASNLQAVRHKAEETRDILAESDYALGLDPEQLEERAG